MYVVGFLVELSAAIDVEVVVATLPEAPQGVLCIGEGESQLSPALAFSAARAPGDCCLKICAILAGETLPDSLRNRCTCFGMMT